MKVTVELSEEDLKVICQATGQKKKGPAIRKFLQDELMMIRRREFMDKCLSGEFGMELKDYERGHNLEQKASERMDELTPRGGGVRRGPKAVAESSREA